ncbi:MAG: hypothetical protein KGZ86_02940 [Candidatus Latescibacteria bacterium]|nr:hypothetical protein [Candidatus Latescibacterota bacterium]
MKNYKNNFKKEAPFYEKKSLNNDLLMFIFLKYGLRGRGNEGVFMIRGWGWLIIKNIKKYVKL